MTQPRTYSYSRYLAAKVSVDDRALNTRVWHSLARALPEARPDAPLRVVEFGAGVGTMVERVLERRLLSHTEYTAVEIDQTSVREAGTRLRQWAGRSGCAVDESHRGWLGLSRSDQTARVEFEAVDAFDFISRERDARSWDLVLAHAFLDLVDLSAILPGMLSLLKPGGLLYFTINYDGLTTLLPEIDPSLDARVEALYNQAMDSRSPSGGSRTGSRLLAYLAASQAQLLDAGASDWVVYPGPQGYEGDEAYFLHHIVNTVWEALRWDRELDGDAFARWVGQRHLQVERAELVYTAHQLDILGRKLPLPPNL